MPRESSNARCRAAINGMVVDGSGARMPDAAPRLVLVLTLAAAMTIIFGACSTPSPPGWKSPAAPAAAPSADDIANLPAALAIERRWLLSWFNGTPVVIGQSAQAVIDVDVPREFCFDAGRTTIKAPLSAVLDKVAESLRRRPAAGLIVVAAPDDAAGRAPLALQRAAVVRDRLLSLGVGPAQLSAATASATAAVQLRIGAHPR